MRSILTRLLFLLGIFFTFTQAAVSTRQSTTTSDKKSSRSSTTISTSTSTSTSISTSSTSTTTSTDDEFSDFSTSALPNIHFIPGNTYYFDYALQVGSPRQEIALRLDLLQGDVWLPASTGFIACSSTSAGVTLPNITLSNLPSTSTSSPSSSSSSSSSSQIQLNSSISATPSSSTLLTVTTTSTSTKSTSSINVTVNMMQTVFGESCASLGVYDILESLYYSFLDVVLYTEVALENATNYIKLYASGLIVAGVWAVDNFTLNFKYNGMNSYEFSNVPFVYANFSNVGVGSLAMGISQGDYAYEYNFISNFVLNDLIKSNSYSLALGAGNGSIPRMILGGVDSNLIYSDATTDSYRNSHMALFEFLPVLDQTGTMVLTDDGLTDSIPVIPIYGWGVTSNTTGESIVFSSSYNDRMRVADYPKPAMLDSRHLYNYIPYSTLVELAIELNAYYSSSLNRWIADCSTGSTGTIDMNIGNYSIHMPISNFLMPATSNDTSLVFASGDEACFLAFLPDYRLGYSLMGTSLLRNIYLAVDNENRQLAISPLEGQLSDLDIFISYTTTSSTTTGTATVTTTTTADSNTITTMIVEDVISSVNRSRISYGISSVSRQELNRTLTLTETTTLANSEVSVYRTVFTRSDFPRETHSTTQPNYYAIESGTIPFGRKFTTITSMTLTIPKSIVFTDTFAQSTEVYISDGEVYFQSNGGGAGGGAGTRSAANSRSFATESTIYAFSSLVVTTISSTTKSSGAGNNLRVPELLRYSPADNNLINTFHIIGYLFTIVIGVVVLL